MISFFVPDLSTKIPGVHGKEKAVQKASLAVFSSKAFSNVTIKDFLRLIYVERGRWAETASARGGGGGRTLMELTGVVLMRMEHGQSYVVC